MEISKPFLSKKLVSLSWNGWVMAFCCGEQDVTFPTEWDLWFTEANMTLINISHDTVCTLNTMLTMFSKLCEEMRGHQKTHGTLLLDFPTNFHSWMPYSFILMPARGPERTENLYPITEVNRCHRPLTFRGTGETHICVSSGIRRWQQGQISLHMEGIPCPYISSAHPQFACSTHTPASSAAVPCIPPIPPILPCDQRMWQSTGLSESLKKSS